MAASLPPHVAGLLDPGVYSHPVEQVDLIQTHISWVLLAGDFVFKLKKPVDFGFLDFRTIEQRRSLCDREVTLNRHLCPEVYLDVVPILQNAGRVSIGPGPDPIVDYAVRMRRMPTDRLLDRLLATGSVGPDDVAAIARRLAAFHDKA